MDLSCADRTKNVKPSVTLAVSARAAELKAQGIDIISLSTGEPDFDTPENIKAAAIKAIDGGQTKYPPVDGTPALKQAIVDKLKRENHLDYDLNQIIVSVGAKQVMYNICQALLNPGDEVVIPAPCWVSYPAMVALSEATSVIVETDIQHHFKISAEQLEKAITPKTKLFLINSPSNPSGAVYSPSELHEIAEVLLRHPHVYIASDDIYEHIYWADSPFQNLVNVCPALKDRTIVVNGVSKAYAMTGWRIGFAAAPAAITAVMKKIQSHSTSGACSIAQAAATEALAGPQNSVEKMCLAFKQRHDYVLDAINSIDGLKVLPCDGAFYAFIHAQPVIDRLNLASDVELAEYLINKANVALVPGSAFSAPGYLRLSFAADQETLEKAIQRIHAALT
jgi:aspartate aminotransferase